MSTIKTMKDVSVELNAAISADLIAANNDKAAIDGIAEKHDVTVNIVRMISLKNKTAASKAAQAQEAESTVTVDNNTEASEEIVVPNVVNPVQTEETKVEATEEAKELSPSEIKAKKLAALKAQIAASAGTTENTATNEASAPTGTKEKAPRKPRAKKNPKDATKRDVVVVKSRTANLAWITGNIDYMNESDEAVLNKINKFAASRKKVKDQLMALTGADDVVVSRDAAIEAEGHEATMAAHFDNLEKDGYAMIGRRPKGFKAAPAPRKKVEATEETSAEDLEAEIAKLMELKAKQLAKKNAESTEQ